MSAAAARKLPDEESFDPADELFTHEVVGGVEMMSPRPARKHIRTETRLNTEIDYHFGGPVGGRRGPGGWLVLMEPELHLGKDKVSPDLCGWRQERAPEINDEAAFDTAPDWVCEVLSPSPKNRKWDRETKMPLYHFHRVGHLWMVDPVARELEVYARGWELLATHSGDDVVRAEPFEALDLHLSLIWPVQQEPSRPARRAKNLKRGKT